MEKQDFSLVKALKYFRVYVLHSKITAYVPSSAIKDILTQSDSDGKRSKWIAKLLEYDMEIKPTKLVKGQGLAKLLVDSNCRALGVDYICNNSGNLHPQNNSSQVNENIVESEWYKDILYFLQNFQAPPGMDKSKVRSLKLKVVKYCVNNQTLFWRDPSGFLLRCLDEEEAQRVMTEFHEGVCGGHHFWKSTAYKILRDGYYWPSLFLMSVQRLEHVKNAKGLLVNKSSSPYLSSL
jgi:hypothetical protein